MVKLRSLTFVLFRISFNKQEGRRHLFWGPESAKHQNWQICSDQVHEESLWQPGLGMLIYAKSNVFSGKQLKRDSGTQKTLPSGPVWIRRERQTARFSQPKDQKTYAVSPCYEYISGSPQKRFWDNCSASPPRRYHEADRAYCVNLKRASNCQVQPKT